jgi:hypothetical protein
LGRQRSSNRAADIIAAYPEHADQDNAQQQLRMLARDADTLIDATVARPDREKVADAERKAKRLRRARA